MNKKVWILLIVLVFGVWWIKFAKHHPHRINLEAKENFWGITYSPKFAEELGLNWQDTYIAILDDLQVKNIRMPIYWDVIEKSEGSFDFSVYDYIFAEGKKRNVKFIANIGWRLPRWPECHAPEWAKDKDVETIQNKTIVAMKEIIERYQDRDEIVAWQVENEPLLDWFGECPQGDEEFLKKEVSFVRSIDNRPIIISASGELSSWSKEIKLADVFGTTMYRVVWNPWFKYFRYPLPAWFYKVKLYSQGKNTDQAIVSELQAEPWVPNGTLADLEYQEYKKSFDIDQFKANLQFAINVDFKQTYLWGVEWWYLKYQQGDTQYWDLGKEIFSK